MKLLARIREFRWGNILISLVTLGIGVAFFAYNNRSLTALAVAIGVLMILGSVLIAVCTIAAVPRGFAYGMRLLFASAVLIAGVTTLIMQAATIDVIISLLGLILVIDGAFKFQTTATSKRYKTWLWVVLLALSVILIGGGYLAIRYLSVEMAATVYLLGALLVIDAAANFLSAFCLAICDRRQEAALRERILAENTAENTPANTAENTTEPPTDTPNT